MSLSLLEIILVLFKIRTDILLFLSIDKVDIFLTWLQPKTTPPPKKARWALFYCICASVFFIKKTIPVRCSHLISHEVSVYLDLSGLVVYLESDFLADHLAEYFQSLNLLKHQFNGAPEDPVLELSFLLQ